jgi:hypothetical protein
LFVGIVPVQSGNIGLVYHDQKSKWKNLATMGMAAEHQVTTLTIIETLDTLGLV